MHLSDTLVFGPLHPLLPHPVTVRLVALLVGLVGGLGVLTFAGLVLVLGPAALPASAANGDIERAMRVYGAAQAVHEKVGLRRSMFQQTLVDAWLGEPLRHAGTFPSAGWAMPLERAVELAVADGSASRRGLARPRTQH